jgi:hypothetical protein
MADDLVTGVYDGHTYEYRLSKQPVETQRAHRHMQMVLQILINKRKEMLDELEIRDDSGLDDKVSIKKMLVATQAYAYCEALCEVFVEALEKPDDWDIYLAANRQEVGKRNFESLEKYVAAHVKNMDTEYGRTELGGGIEITRGFQGFLSLFSRINRDSYYYKNATYHELLHQFNKFTAVLAHQRTSLPDTHWVTPSNPWPQLARLADIIDTHLSKQKSHR